MTLKFIDISSHQTVEVAGTEGVDGVIVKATQDLTYINPKCDDQYQYAKSNGKLLGTYHYAGGKDPVAEADFYLKNIRGYLYESVPALDWESYQNAAWGDHSWCRRFVDRFHEKTGVWPMIYVQASALAQVSNCANNCALWIAGYPTNEATWNAPSFNYSTSPWPTYTLWQFTSGGNLDRNLAQVSDSLWKKIANPEGTTVEIELELDPKPPVVYATTLEGMVKDVENGLYGNGQARVDGLGKYFNGVQAILNYQHGSRSFDSTLKTLVAETIAGVYGNGSDRKKMLGSYFLSVQNYINANQPKVYTVETGDSLSLIGYKLGVNWLRLAEKNGIKPPYTIRPGDKLKY